MRALLALLLLGGCASVNFAIAYPKVGNHYGHTYYGVCVQGTTK